MKVWKQITGLTRFPLPAVNISLNNYQSVNVLGVSWMRPAGKVDHYTVGVTGAVTVILTNNTQVNVTGLLPGREYNVTVRTDSDYCFQTSAPVTEATYPAPPGSLTLSTIGTNSLTVSWIEPLTMIGVTKFYNIMYGNSLGTWTTTSSSTNVVLPSLISGTMYTIAVVTVGVRGYQSSPVSTSVYTKPMSVKSPFFSSKTSSSLSLVWSMPDEYQASYRYRVQINVTSSSTMLYNTIVTSGSVTISNLTPGETYTFLVYTRAADSSTESDPVLLSTCTVPGKIAGLTVNIDHLPKYFIMTWMQPEGKVDYYTVNVIANVAGTDTVTVTWINTTQVNVSGLLPGREYNVTVQTVSGNCNQSADPITVITYPTSIDKIEFFTVETNTISLHLLESTDMNGTTRSYIISYTNSSGTWTVTSRLAFVTLQDLTSGTMYTITAMTVGVQGYQTSPVSTSVYTKPNPVSSLYITNVTSSSVSLSWNNPDSNKASYIYRVHTVTPPSSAVIYDIYTTSESATIMNTLPLDLYSFVISTRAADNTTESDPVLLDVCTIPDITPITLDNYQSVDTLRVTWTQPAENVRYLIHLGDIVLPSVTTQAIATGLLPGREYNVTVQTLSNNCDRTSAPVTGATNPTPPGDLTFIPSYMGTNSLTLYWTEPVNMTGVTKSYNISYGNSSGTWTVTSSRTSVALQNLTSGTMYTITVVTVGVRGYQSSPVSASAYTQPNIIPLLFITNSTSSSVSLSWSHDDMNKASYSYRVHVIPPSSADIYDIYTINESITITNLAPFQQYLFLIYTRAADNMTESYPVSLSTCTCSDIMSITLNNYQSIDTLGVTWTQPAEDVNYQIYIIGAEDNTIETANTEATFTGLLPGREYNVTVIAQSVTCGRIQASVVGATYPTAPGNITINKIGTNNLTLSWTEPVNMTGVNKSYNISYVDSSNTWTVISNVTNVTLQDLISGTIYVITVVTVGVRGYQSSPVGTFVYTNPVSSFYIVNMTSSSVSLSWRNPDLNKASYIYRVHTVVPPSSAVIYDIYTTSESVTITNITPLERYTFMVYTRAADNITESDPMSLSTCAVPDITAITLDNYHSVDTLGVTWTPPADNMYLFMYSVILSGAANIRIQTLNTEENFTGLLPGTEYNVTVQATTADCGLVYPTSTGATYPTPPENLTFITVGTNRLTLSWMEPVNMTGVNKSYNISYGTSLGTSTVISSTTNVTLQNLTSGICYLISVVTVGVWGYQSSPVSRGVCTQPMTVKSLQFIAVSSSSVSLTWNKPDEYQTVYTYRVQTNVASSSIVLYNTTVRNESATIMNLTAGETYTFMVYTRALDGITESDPVSVSTCTVPGQVSTISLNNYQSVDVLRVGWMRPIGKVDYYIVRVSGDVTDIIPTDTTEVTVTGLLPGREYEVTVQTVSGSCSQTSDPVTEATYPTPPGDLSFTTIGTDSLTLSWTEPVNMTGVNKSYNISYGNSSGTWTVTSTTTSVTLQDLIGTNYTITVMTVGVRGYQSSPVSTSLYTKPLPVKSLEFGAVSSSSVSLIWSNPDEYKTSYTYRVQTNVPSSSTMLYNTTVTNGSATISNLTAGETYTFMVYTRAADNTESDPVSLSTCAVPEQVSAILINNYQSDSLLGVSWTKPAGNVDYYIVNVTGAVTNSIQTNTTQVTVTGLLPGREYNVTVQTVSGNCSQTSDPVSGATYPTPPGNITISTTGTNSLTLSWTEPVNMIGVNKSYNINYGNSSSPWTVTSNTTSVALQNLTSGTMYTITVVTVGVRGYQSSPVGTSVYTKPLPVKSPQSSNVTSSSVSLTWSNPDEYKTSYTYRVQTNVTSSSTMLYNTIVTNGSATISNLTAGETYTFMVYTRAADNSTESDPVSLSTCTVPGQVSSIAINKSVNVLGVFWTRPEGKVDYYIVNVTGAVTNSIQTNTTQANVTGLLPGREYNVTVQTVSGSCNQTSAPVTEATYPTPPRNLTINSTGTNSLTLYWTEPVNMTSVNKIYNISYGNSSSPWTVTSNTTSVALQNLTSGTMYTITVVTVGVRGYQSSPVSTSVYTKPLPVKSPQVSNVTSSSVFLTWSNPDEYKPSYTYRVQTNVTSSSTMLYNTIMTNGSVTISNLTAGETYTFLVYTRAADNTESDPVSLSTCTVPSPAVNISLNNYKSVDVLGVSWTKPAGKVDYYIVNVTGDITDIWTNNTGAVTNSIQTNTTQVTVTGLLPGREYNVTVRTVSDICYQTSAPVTEATYPTPPRNLTINSTGTNSLTLYWTEPVNMAGVNKSYNISYGNSSSPWSVTSNTTSVALQNLTSGTMYTITVVTVGVRGYQSSPVSTSLYTKPLPVKSPQISNVTSSSVSLTWSNPDEYKPSYTYRVQTNVASSSTMLYNTTLTNGSATISNLTAGETYTFLVYTRAADDTESDPVSLSTCTVPLPAVNISLNNYKSVDVLGVSWTKPAGKVDYYTVNVTGDVTDIWTNNTGAVTNSIQTNTTQVTVTGLLPGREYNVTVQTVSGSCNQTSAPVTEATYPTPPRNLTINSTGTNSLTLYWTEPVNMTSVNKIYNISYGNSSSPWTVTSNTTSVALQNLTSGTMYTITVVTVGVRGYQSSPVSTSVYTKPLPVKSPQVSNVTSSSVFLTWSNPDEYKPSYTYRVQTNVTSSSTMLYNTIMTNGSVTISNLTAGETYTFLVYTRAADNTESDPVSLSTCTVPLPAVNISLNNYKSVDVLGVSWTKPAGKVDYYTVNVTGDVTDIWTNNTGAVTNSIQTNTTQVTVTGLLPGREYNVTVQTVSGSCNQTSAPVTEATYPTPPRNLTINSTGTNSLMLYWTEPVNMTGVDKSYNISYGNSSSPWTVTSNTTSVALQNLTSGTMYTITVVTVGVRGYQSSPVSTSVYTKPLPVKSPQISNVTSSSVSLIWSNPDEYKTSYTYRVQTNVASSSTMLYNTTVTNGSATISNLTAGETYTFMVYTRAADNTESDPVSLSTCTVPLPAVNISLNNYKSVNVLGVSWMRPAGKVDYYTVNVTGDITDIWTNNTGAVTNSIQTNNTQVTVTGLLPGREYNVTVRTVSGSCNQMSAPVTEATYPTPPRNLTINSTGTNSLTLYWTEPVNMAGVDKSYNISYGNSSSPWTVTSNTTSVALQNLTSGTMYTITVVTVGVRGYQSSPVSTSVYTKPLPVKSPQISNVTSSSVSLIWSNPEEYKTSYTYRVQTNVASSSTMLYNTIVTNGSATISNLTAGETYTFLVYTRAADNTTESDPVSLSTCTVPSPAVNISLNNYKSVDVLGVSWTKPAGKVDYYIVNVTGDITDIWTNNTGAVTNSIQTNTTQVTVTGLLPGREYNVTVQTVSGSCNQTSAPVTEATYPTPPRNLTINSTGTNSLTLYWTEPVNMAGVNKSYNISYGNSSSPWTVTSNTTSVALQNLTSGTMYTITVVTVGVRGYQSSPVSTSLYTKPLPVKSPQISNVTSSSVSLTWSNPDEYKTSYTYRVQTNVASSSTMLYNTTLTNGSATISNLTPGETYTFMVYTRAADNTESDPVSLSTCTVPLPAVNISLNNYKSVDVLGVSWMRPAGKVDYYIVNVTGDITDIWTNNTGAVTNSIQTNTTQVTVTGLLPGREYNVTVQTVSRNCNQTSAPVTEATYPTPPRNLTINSNGTNSLTLYWTEPVNMAGVNKSYNISYGNSSSPWTVTSNTTSVALQNLTSGTMYTITVVTVGVRGYQSSPVGTSVYTKPLPVKSLQFSPVSSSSVSLIWSNPDEYKTSYTYRVQTNVPSSSTMLYNTIVTSGPATISNLTPGETYTFMVYTRAADNTESDPVSLSTCTVPLPAVNISLNNYKSVDVLGVSWTKPAGKVDYYIVNVTGDVTDIWTNNTGAVTNSIQTNTTQVTVTGLLPGREYNVTVQTVSGSCNQTSAPVTEATYPTPPRNLTINSTGTNSLTLYWTEPVNMAGVTKSYNISYGNSSGTWTVTSNTTSVALQNLTSGTMYTITVVTVGVRGYQSSPVSTSVYTKPLPVKSLQFGPVSSSSVSLIWSNPDEYKTSYRYRVQTNVASSSTMLYNTTLTNGSATISNLTAGETYTFMVYTRAADNTESDPVSLSTCTGPGQVSVALNNSNSVSSLVVSWTRATGKVDYYNVILSGDTRAIPNDTTQVNFTNLIPGREYTATVQVVSGSCNQTSESVTEATYPTPPRNLTINSTGTNSLMLYCTEPVNMAGVNKSYNISYGNSSGTWTVTSNTTNVALQNLTSGTMYTITVVTVGVRGYQSSPVSTSVYTKPLPVKSLQFGPVTSSSVSLTWSNPEEYKTSYRYRVQTNVASSSTMLYNTTVTNGSATISNLTAGETYTFMVYTRAADNTESDPVSLSTCTGPGQVSVALNNSNSVSSLVVSWTRATGKVDYYNVILSGDTRAIPNDTTQVNFTNLIPGREYTATVQVVSGSCNQTSESVTEATYPMPPSNLSVNIIGTNNLMLYWTEPVNMTNVTKSYNISYGTTSGTRTVTSNTTSVALQSLISGTMYNITVVTVGVRGYLSSPVSTSVYTKPKSVKSLQFGTVNSSSVSLTWSNPDEYKPSYTYRVQTNLTSSSTMLNDTIVTGGSATIGNLTAGETYTFLVYTRAADNSTESDPVSLSTCTVPQAVSDFNCTRQPYSASIYLTWNCPPGLKTIFTLVATNSAAVSSNRTVQPGLCSQNYTMDGLSFNMNYDVNITTESSCGRSSTVVQTSCTTGYGPPPYPTKSTVVTVKPPSPYSFEFTFEEFNATNGPVEAYAVIVSNVNVLGKRPTSNDLIKTYNDVKNKSSNTYVAKIVHPGGRTRRSLLAATQTVTIGDDSVDNSAYRNGPLQPSSSYWVAIAGCTPFLLQDGMIARDVRCSFSPYSSVIKTPVDPNPIIGGVIGGILGVLVIGLIGGFIFWKMRRKAEQKSELALLTNKNPPAMTTSSFINHFEKQKADCNLGFSEEYEKLAPVGLRQSKSAAEIPENKDKNRYTNVLPYDFSRVELSTRGGDPTQDYINANYIPGYSFKREFIAAQGPLPKTVSDFWRMVWDKDVKAIVMLTKCIELGKVKCEEYWPKRSPKTYGNFSVSMTDENILPDWTTRDFTIVNVKTKQSKQVRHFHFTAWPDHGVPKTTSDLIRFRNLVREYTTSCYSLDSPILVHCSAGVGRTGTFIALDRIIKQIELEDRIDVYSIVSDIRQHRVLMVQTESQYIFLNQCALDIIKSQKESDPDLIYQNTSIIYPNIYNSYSRMSNV
ncbi:uncharacterized protein LOC142214420 [Leptodactylus fuscus]|uniref:uncharacterized protein LOC142214420 n=1 Tax=Leptodactylus fuscus TaxID=238119 RepID=UPI003F4EE053